MAWLFGHAGFLLNKYHIGPDKLTGYMRLHGKAGRFDKIAEFCEADMRYVPMKLRL